MQQSVQVAIGANIIRQIDGLYSLNDLHRASGGADNHRPAQFMRTEQTQGMIAELCKSAQLKNCVRSTRGKLGGTFVCRELVYAYAMWISAAFCLTVIRAFDAMYSPQAAYHVARNQTLSAEQADELRSLITTHAETLPKENRAAFIIQAWSKLRAHFGVSYRQIPAHLFSEALSIIGRHMAATLPAPNLSALPAEALAAARKLALDYFDAIQAGKKNPRVGEIPEEVLTGIVANMLMNNRWLVSFDPFSGRMNTLRIDPSAFMVTAEQLPGFIREPLNIPAKTLFDIQAACHERIRNKFGAMEEARFIANAKR